MAARTVPPEQVRSRLEAMGVAVEEATTTALTDLDRALNLNAAAIGLGLDDIVYDPDRFPGLIYQSDEPTAVAVVFGDGTVLVESATPSGARDVVADIAGRFADLGLLDDATPTTDYEVSPTAVPVPPEYEVESGGTETAVYSDGAAAGEQTTDADGETSVYRAADSAASEPDAPDERVELYCPDCGLARPKDAGTLRPGDICPECKRGYIAEREA